MNRSWIDAIPETLHDAAKEAVTCAFDDATVSAIDPVLGGASGAAVFRIEVRGRPYLLRLETRRGPFRNPHQYTCMRIAAEGGIAPALHYADDKTGAAILDFLTQQPLQDYPGGPPALAEALGELARELQATPLFPVLGDYRVFLEKMLAYLRSVFAPSLLDPHFEGFERIRQSYRWDAESHVSVHNDPNPRNILFDGQRLWLIDWETAYRNDPLVDVAILIENHAQTPELEDVLVQSWLGREANRGLGARLRLMRLLTRLYYAGLLLMSTGKPAAPLTDLEAPTPDEFRKMVAAGNLQPTAVETRVILTKMLLAGFLAAVSAPGFQEALSIAQDG